MESAHIKFGDRVTQHVVACRIGYTMSVWFIALLNSVEVVPYRGWPCVRQNMFLLTSDTVSVNIILILLRYRISIDCLSFVSATSMREVKL